MTGLVCRCIGYSKFLLSISVYWIAKSSLFTRFARKNLLLCTYTVHFNFLVHKISLPSEFSRSSKSFIYEDLKRFVVLLFTAVIVSSCLFTFAINANTLKIWIFCKLVKLSWSLHVLSTFWIQYDHQQVSCCAVLITDTMLLMSSKRPSFCVGYVFCGMFLWERLTVNCIDDKRNLTSNVVIV